MIRLIILCIKVLGQDYQKVNFLRDIVYFMSKYIKLNCQISRVNDIRIDLVYEFLAMLSLLCI